MTHQPLFVLAIAALFAACGGSFDEDDLDAAMQKETPPGDWCGDGFVGGSEECEEGDGTGVRSCGTIGQPEGRLMCEARTCTWDTTLCLGVGVCGNGLLDPGEHCDQPGADEHCAYGAESCSVCRPDCTLGPGLPRVCGDGVRQLAEQCDGDDMGTSTCATLAYRDGELRCTASCQLDYGLCVRRECGDGVVDPGEECEPTGDASLYCEWGQTACVVCNRLCREMPGRLQYCGDGVVQDAYEACDWGESPACDDGQVSVEGCNDECTGPVTVPCDDGGDDAGAVDSGSDAVTADAGDAEPAEDGAPQVDADGEPGGDDGDAATGNADGGQGGCSAARASRTSPVMWTVALAMVASLRRRKQR